MFKLVTIKTSKYVVSFTLVIKHYPVAQQTAFMIMDTMPLDTVVHWTMTTAYMHRALSCCTIAHSTHDQI